MTEIQPFPRPSLSDAALQWFAEEMREQTKKRQQMKRALKSVMTSIFRRHGFTGTSPHFRRLRPERYDLFMFDFCRGYDGFSIQVGQCAPDDVSSFRGEKLRPKQIAEFYALVPPGKMTAEHLRLDQRARVQPRCGVKPGDFFEYGNAKTGGDYKGIALLVVPFVEKTIAGFEDFARFAQIEKLDKR